LERRIIGVMQHHRIKPDEIAGHLFVDTERERSHLVRIPQTKIK